MALSLSILKTVLNLNHNCMHVTGCETTTVTVHICYRPQRIEYPEHGVQVLNRYETVYSPCAKCRENKPFH